jgi:hypothetical protein
MQGFSLHAAVRCAATERVQTNAAGQVVPKLKTAWRDGTTHLVLRPDTNSPEDRWNRPDDKGQLADDAQERRLSASPSTLNGSQPPSNADSSASGAAFGVPRGRRKGV